MIKQKSGDQTDQMREALHRQMLSTVSHDLKTPLATVIGSLEIMERLHDKLTPEKRAQLLRSALSEAYRLDGFITNILDMMKLEGETITVKHEICDIRSLVQDCLIRLGPKRETARFSVPNPEDSFIIRTDPMLFSRAVGLLLDNAIKHSGAEPEITISFYQNAGETHFIVKDNGGGIPPGKEEEIFCKYARLSKFDRQNAGTGLGLTICRAMVSVLGGTVKAASAPEGGGVFSVILPA